MNLKLSTHSYHSNDKAGETYGHPGQGFIQYQCSSGQGYEGLQKLKLTDTRDAA